jgi:hypothetical protein
MAYEPGPFWVREPMPLAPRAAQPREFEGLGAQLSRDLGGVDAGLGANVSILAPATSRNLDGAYAADVAPAFDGLAQMATPAEAAALAVIAGAADTTLGDLASQARDLPGANEGEPSVGAPPVEDPGEFPGLD